MPDRRLGNLLQLDVIDGLTAESLLLGARRWAGLTFTPFFLTSLAGLLTLAGSTLLLRELRSDDAGSLALLLALLDTFSLLGILGQTSLVTRLYSPTGRDAYDWLFDLTSSAVFSVIPIALATLIAAQIYDFEVPQLAFLAGAALLTVVHSVGCYMLNAHGHYIVSSLLLRLPNTLLILPGVLATRASSWAELQPVLLAYGAGLLLCSLILIFTLTRLLRRGPIRISLRERFEGLVFFASTTVALMPDQGVVVIAGALMTPERLAPYAAMAVLLRPFRLVTQVLSAIMTPELIRRERPNYRGLLIGLWTLAIVAALATILLGPPLARWIYEGRYEEGLGIIPLLALVGALQLTAVLPKSDLTGKAAMATFRRLVFSLVGVMAGIAAFGVLLISRFGVLGMAATAFSLQAARSLLAYGFWRGFRKAAEAKPG